MQRVPGARFMVLALLCGMTAAVNFDLLLSEKPGLWITVLELTISFVLLIVSITLGMFIAKLYFPTRR
jgi:hypothetical protein